MSKLINGNRYVFSNPKGQVYIGTFEMCSGNIFCGKNERHNSHETYHEAIVMNIINHLDNLKTAILNELHNISCDASIDGCAQSVIFYNDYEDAVSNAFNQFEIKKA